MVLCESLGGPARSPTALRAVSPSPLFPRPGPHKAPPAKPPPQGASKHMVY